jgi:DNA-binding MarR family transcriptional regulator
MRLEDHLCFSIYTAHRAITAAYAVVLDPLGLTYPQYVTLLALRDADDVAVVELAARLRLDSGTLTPILQRLDRAGHVSRARDPVDERRVRVRLTDAGRATIEAALGAVAARLCSAPIDPTRLATLRDELWELTAALTPPAAATSSPRR